MPTKEAAEAIEWYQQYGGWAISATLVFLAFLTYKKVILPFIDFLKNERIATAAKFEEKDQKNVKLVENLTKELSGLKKYVRDIAKTLADCGVPVKDRNGDKTVMDFTID